MNDPLLRPLRDKLGLRDSWIIIGATILTGAVIIGIPLLLSGKLPSKAREWISLYDHEWLTTLVVIPFSFLTYLWFPSAIAALFDGLKANGVIGSRRVSLPGPSSYEDLVQQVVAWTNSYWWIVIWLIYGLGHGWVSLSTSADTAFYLVVREEHPLWLKIIIHLVYLPARLTVLMSCIRLVVVLFWTRQLFRLFHVRIPLLHPDGVAGFGALRRLVTVGLLVAALLGIIAAAMSIVLYFKEADLSTSPAILVLGVIYIVATPTFFLCWLWEPHRAMQEARDTTLRPLVDAFYRALDESMASAKEDTLSIKTETDRLAELKRQYDFLLNMFPTWPVQLRPLRGLAITSILPLLSSLIPIIDFITKKHPPILPL